MDTISLVILTFIILLLVFWSLKEKNDHAPPGPKGWPIIGYIPYMTSKPYLDFMKVAKIYGPVFSLKLGSQSVIVLNDFHSIKEAFSKDAFMGRPPESAFEANEETVETQAIIGLPWREQRRFSLRVLRDLGFGKSKLDNMIKEEINDLLTHFEGSQGKPTFFRPLLASSMSNNIASLIYGRKLKHGDPERVLLNQVIREFSANAGQAAWQFFFPWTRKCLKFFRFGVEGRVDHLLRKMKEFTRKEIAHHEETLDVNSIRDYIDGYLLEIQKNKDKAFCSKRSCPGEPFARSEIFLYLVCILQKFQVRLPDGVIPDFEGVLGISLAPKSFEICTKKRN